METQKQTFKEYFIKNYTLEGMDQLISMYNVILIDDSKKLYGEFEQEIKRIIIDSVINSTEIVNEYASKYIRFDNPITPEDRDVSLAAYILAHKITNNTGAKK